MPNRHQRRRTAALARQERRRFTRVEAAGRSMRFAVPVEIKAAEGGKQRFRMSLYTGEPLDLDNFDLPVVIDCASIDLSVQRLPALLNHTDYPDTIVGQTDRWSVQANGLPPLMVEGYFTPTDEPNDAAVFVAKKAAAGFQWQASIGSDPGYLEKVAAGQTAHLNGRAYQGPIYIARDSVPREASFVVIGADRNTSVLLARRRRIKGSAMPTFEDWVASLGFVATDLTEQQRAALQIQYDEKYGTTENETPPTNAEGDVEDDENPNPDVTASSETEDDEELAPTNANARRPAIQGQGRQAPGRQGTRRNDPPPNPRRQRVNPVEDENRRLAANRTRIVRIGEICASANNPRITARVGGRDQEVDLQAHAIANNWSPTRTELEVLRHQRGPGPTVVDRSRERDCTIQAMQGAMLLRFGGRLDHPAYQTPAAAALRLPAWLRAPLNDSARNQFMEASHRYSRWHPMQVARESFRLSGQDAPHDDDDMIRAAFSGMSLVNVFTTNVNAVLLSTYVDAPDTTVGWTSEQEVADFRTNERPRMTKGSRLTKHPVGKAEADHMTRSDVGESYKIARYTGQVVVDEQDFINDNLGALADVPVDMGQAAACLRPDLVYAILMLNANLTATGRALCNTTEGNRKTSAALAADKIRAAVAAQMAFRENNRNLNLVSSHVLVPTDLFFLAGELCQSAQLVIAGTAGSVTERGAKNVLSDLNLSVVSDGRLTNGVVDPDSEQTVSGSTSTWWTACNKAHTIEVGYRRGTGRAPQSRPFKLDQGKWGMGWDVAMDIGAKALDWKGFVRNEQ